MERNEIDGVVHGSVVQASTIHTVVIGGTPEARRPSALPRDTARFLNRAPELADLDGLLDSAGSASVAITGVGGVGKTALAVRWAHQVKSRFSDGVVYAELGGSLPTGPIPVGTLLTSLLRQLGVDDVPATDKDKLALYRSRTAELEILIVLDDAYSAGQVSALMPSSLRSAVIVTSRSRLDGLLMDGFHATRLDPLETSVALELVSNVVGGRLRPEDRVALETLVSLCGGLPLALQAAATQLTTRYRGSVARFVALLADERDRLKSFSVDNERLVEAVFEVCYRELDAEQARAYRLLGLWNGPDFDVAAAAALLDRREADTVELLEDLVQANLLGAEDEDRYRFHSLIRWHARDRADQHDELGERADALRRAVRHYRDFLIARDQVLSNRPRVCAELYAEIPATADKVSALADLEAERPNLLAAVLTAGEQQFADHAWQLCVALFPLYFQRSHYEDWIATHQVGLQQAAQVGNQRAQVQLHNQLGSAYFELRKNSLAREQYELSRQLAEVIDDPMGQQSAWEWTGFIHERRNEFDEALRCFDKARAFVARWPEDKQARALALYAMNSGRVLVEAGRAQEAMLRLDEAMRFFVQDGDSVNVAKTAASLGKGLLSLERPEDALAALERALEVLVEQGSLAWQADVHANLATVADQLGRTEQAQAHRAEVDRLEAERLQRVASAE